MEKFMMVPSQMESSRRDMSKSDMKMEIIMLDSARKISLKE
jgi:hypothetical protein